MLSYPAIRFPGPILLYLLALVGMVLLLGAIFGYLGAYLSVWLFDIPDATEFLQSQALQEQYPKAFLLTQGLAATGSFIIPAIILAGMLSVRFSKLFQLRTFIIPKLFFLILIMAYAINPTIEFLYEINRSVELPTFLKGLEDYLIRTNDEIQASYEMILSIHGVWQLLITLLVVAVIPALGEELVFRGALQPLFQNWMRNAHWGIWISAILFSAVHLQFYVFLPRLALGALFGYMYYWSGNLWYPVIAHFLNNALAVVIAFYFSMQEKEIDLEEVGDTGLWTGVFFTVILIFVIFLFRKIAVPQRKVYGPEEMGQDIHHNESL